MADAVADPTWVCVGCRARVPMAENVCTSCGRPFGEGLADAAERERTQRDLSRWGWLLREFVLLNVLFVIWRIVGHYSLFHQSGAFGRGRWLWHAERVLHLPSEAAMQRDVLGHATLDRIANGYYAWAHIVVFAAMLLWLMVRHRDVYPKWRNLVVGFTGISLLIGFIPIAPPRLIPSFGMVDLAARYHQSVYDGLGKGITDQLSAMPSVHVGWAVLVAAAVIAVCKSRWRWLVLIHPVITTYFIIVTANHYWLDGLAALLLLALIYFGMRRLGESLVP
ncbi:MAG TPA: phosphatase PAP2 family protein [Mycobacteriales bacterium]|nr:phosphatase PAP2 family protein [Mycobacteriales bacterium]